MKVAVALITALVAVLMVFGMDLNQPEGCTIYELGDTFGEDWSPSVNFSGNISASVHSPKNSWQEFSFGFESLEKDPIGYLKFWKYSGIILTLRNSDRSNVGTEEETQKLPEDFVSKAFLKEWTVISLKRNNDTLMVDVDGKHAAHFTKVDIKPFHHVYAYVPPNQYINVGFNCPQGESLSEIVSQSEDPTESGAGAGVAVVIVLLLVGVAAAGGGGFWYWKKQKEKGEPTWMSVAFRKGSRHESEAERGEKGSLLDEDGKIKDDGKKEGNLPISKNSSKVDLLNVGALFENGQDEDKSLPTTDEGGQEQDDLQSSSKYNLTQDTNNETQIIMETTDDKSTSEGILLSKNTSGEQDKHEEQDTEICKQEGTEIAKEESAEISKEDSTEIGKEESTKITKEEGAEITKEESAEIAKDTQLAEDLLSEIESQIIPDKRLMNEAQVLHRQNSTDFDEIAVDALDTMTSNQEHNLIQEGNEAVEKNNSETETTSGIDDIKIPEVKRDEKWDSDDGNRACVEEPCVQVITKKAGDSEYTQPERIKEIQEEMPSPTDPSESGNDSIKNEGGEEKKLCDSMLGSSNQAAKDFMAIVGDPHYDEMTNRETPVFKAQSSSKTKDARKDSSNKYRTKHTP